jgi:hypothetical protein
MKALNLAGIALTIFISLLAPSHGRQRTESSLQCTHVANGQKIVMLYAYNKEENLITVVSGGIVGKPEVFNYTTNATEANGSIRWAIQGSQSLSSLNLDKSTMQLSIIEHEPAWKKHIGACRWLKH